MKILSNLCTAAGLALITTGWAKIIGGTAAGIIAGQLVYWTALLALRHHKSA